MQLTAGVPHGVAVVLVAVLHAFVHVGLGVTARQQDLPQQRDVGDGEPQGVDLRQSLLVGESGHVAAQLLEGRVDAQHPLPLPDVGGVPLHLVRGMHSGPARPARALCAEAHSSICAGGAVRLCADASSRGLRVEVSKGHLRVREPGPGGELAADCTAVHQEGVQLGLKRPGVVRLSPKCKLWILVIVKQQIYVLHDLKHTFSDGDAHVQVYQS